MKQLPMRRASMKPVTMPREKLNSHPTALALALLAILASGGTVLRFDTAAGQFVYNWQTPKKPGFCYVVTITLTDGSSLSGKVQLR